MTCACIQYPAADPMVARYGLGAPAVRYITRGYAVLPLVRGGKKPHRMLPWSPQTPSGVHLATSSTEDATGLWRLDPAANIGVATGQVSRLVVIDLDVKRGQNGMGVFWQFCQDNRLLFPAPPCHVHTPSGGLHIWLRTPAGVTVPERPGILPGVDVKGDGGLVVAPPSMVLRHGLDRPGEGTGTAEVPVPYTWAAGCPCTVPDAPAWLLPWLASAPTLGSPSSPGAGGDGENGEGPDIASLRRTGIPRGQRNATLYRLACGLYRKHGTSAEGSLEVMEALTEVWRAGDRTGMPPHELRTIADSARRFVSGREQEEQQYRDITRRWLNR